MLAGRLLITGADGFVGRRLAARLAGDGVPLTLATRTGGSGTAAVRRVAVGGIDRHTDWSDALRDVTAVVHLAARAHAGPARTAADAAVFDEVNHRAAVRLFEDASRIGVPTFVFISTILVLGDATVPGRPFDEASMPAPATPYAWAKHAAERALGERAARATTRLVVLRPPLVCGPGVGGNLLTLARVAALPVPLPFGAVRNRRTLLSLDNLVAAIRAALDGGPGTDGVFNLGDRAPLSTADIVRHLRAGLGRAPGLVSVPPGLLRGLATISGAGGLARRLLGDLEVDPRRFRSTFGFADVVETADALRLLGAASAKG